MCDDSQPEGMDRRKFLTRAGLVAGVAATTAAMPSAAAATPPPEVRKRGHDARRRTRVILLGTAGGPDWKPGASQGICSVLMVEDSAYMVDCGDGAGRQWVAAGIGNPQVNNDFSQLRGVFLTHMHTDHMIDLPALILYGHPSFGSVTGEPVPFFGPGPRESLPDVYPPHRPEPPTVNADNPTPGIAETVDYMFQMFSTDINSRIRGTGRPDPRDAVAGHDIVLPPGIDPNPSTTPTLSEPIPVYEDDLVRVTATLADHGSAFPSFAFRFDTSDGSVVFSGDTTVHDNVTALSEDVDVLVHEVIDEDWVDERVANLPPDRAEALRHHLIGAHTTIEQVGQVAESAGARALVLSHLVPGNNPRRRWKDAQRGYSGRLVVGEDLAQIGVGARRR